SLRWLEASVAAEASIGHGAAKASTGHGAATRHGAATGRGAATGHDTNRRSTGRPVTPDGTGRDLQQLPRVAAPSGINYVELSTDDLGTLTRQLHQLGLRFIGFHRSKPQVQLWRRGSARIIITEVDPETARGTFLRGIGFEVSDASASMDRASLLHAVEVPREQTHNDEVLRGVFAPDGSEVFFHQATGDDPIWVAEFGTGGVEQSSRIDHINLAQPAHHYDEAVLFYTSLLALEAQPSQDVPSPSGLEIGRASCRKRA